MTIPLDLVAEVTTATGARYKWGANEPPGSRLQNFSFHTKIGEGFSDGAGQLGRRIDQDYSDLNLLDTVTFTGADGTVAYEGRVSAMPRELTDKHMIGVTLAGWMAHAKDRKFTEIYVDRALDGWGPPSLGRKAALINGNWMVNDPGTTTDPTDSTAGVALAINGGWTSPYKPISEAWYDAGPGLTIGIIGYSWKRNGGLGSAAPWSWFVFSATDDKTGSTGTADLVAAGPSINQTVAFAVPTRYALLQISYGSTPAGAAGAIFELDWYKLAVYGSHNVNANFGEPNEPAGYFASNVMRDIASRFCPQLDISGIVDTNYVIQHCVFKDRTFPYDAFLELNKYHLWHLGVWENKKLTFRPYDLTDYMWEIRTDDPGTTFTPQGPSTDSLFNGITVTYTDVLTGIVNTLTPDTNPELSDTSTDNPWNQQGMNGWDEIELSTPTTATSAALLGAAALADRNRPKTPGTITVQGYIRDRAGAEQPGWKVRAGDTISITNFPNDEPRLIVETSWDDEAKTLTLSIDKPFALLSAYLDRQSIALQAKGLTR